MRCCVQCTLSAGDRAASPADMVAPAPAVPGGESGTTTVAHLVQTVRFSSAYRDPIVFVGVPTHNGGHEVVMRLTALSSDGFEVYADESRCRDDWHATEQVAWLVVEGAALRLSCRSWNSIPGGGGGGGDGGGGVDGGGGGSEGDGDGAGGG